MTDEEINRKFDVVADHLASLAVGQQRLQETQERAEQRWERTEGSIRSLLAITEIQSQEIRELGQGMRELGGAVRVIDERNRETDERLSALTNMVERYISDRRNGKSDNGKSDN